MYTPTSPKATVSPAALPDCDRRGDADADNEDEIVEALQRLVLGRNVIAVAHRLSTLRNVRQDHRRQGYPRRRCCHAVVRHARPGFGFGKRRYPPITVQFGAAEPFS